MSKFQKEEISIINVDILRCSAENFIGFKDLMKNIVNGGSRKIILNFICCKYFDDSFLLCLLVQFKELTILNGDVKIVVQNELAAQFFKRSKINKVIGVYDRISEAIGTANKKSSYKQYSIKC